MTPPRLAEIPVVFYRTSGGAEPVLGLAAEPSAEDRRAIGTDLATVQFGWPIGMPLCRPLGGRVMGIPQHAAEPAHRAAAVFRP